jgi:hypothetical protein
MSCLHRTHTRREVGLMRAQHARGCRRIGDDLGEELSHLVPASRALVDCASAWVLRQQYQRGRGVYTALNAFSCSSSSSSRERSPALSAVLCTRAARASTSATTTGLLVARAVSPSPRGAAVRPAAASFPPAARGQPAPRHRAAKRAPAAHLLLQRGLLLDDAVVLILCDVARRASDADGSDTHGGRAYARRC